MIDQLDKDLYDESALIEIKVPLHTPYIPDRNTYERYDGQFEVNGVTYNYVKRKISADTLYMLCLPNKQSTRLLAVKKEYGKQVIDLPSQKKEKDSPIKKAGEQPQCQDKPDAISFMTATTSLIHQDGYIRAKLSETYIPKEDQPPEASFISLT